MSSIRKPVSSGTDAEALLASLAGVVSAHVVTGSTGRIVEIHVLARAGLHPKQVVRNVESALSAGLGLAVDRRIISVAQVRSPDVGGSVTDHQGAGRSADPTEKDGAPPAIPELGDRGRLEFVRYRSDRRNDRCTCEVVLRGTGGEVQGRATGADTAGGRAEAAAHAVLDGIRAAHPDLRIELDGAALSSSRGRTFVLVAAHILLDREAVPLAGAAAMTRSPEEAAIIASLQATNRWIG